MRIPTTSTLVILTGAGISAESGISTFRDSNGLWEKHRIEDVATPEAFARDPKLVHRFYNLRRAQLKTVEPNAAHFALARLEAAWPGEFLLITQNVDNLHERAGSRKVAHMHGEICKVRCVFCQNIHPWDDDVTLATPCPECGTRKALRPQIVWFGEMPLQLGQIHEALANCGFFASIGTSGVVYPAAGFIERVSPFAYTIEINKESTEVGSGFFEQRKGNATECVPAMVEELLAGLLVPMGDTGNDSWDCERGV